MLWWLLACSAPTPPQAAAPEAAPEGVQEAAPLLASLYAGETGGEAEAMGDRVRLLIWLRGLRLTGEQPATLRSAAVAVRGLQAEAAASRAAREAAEAEVLAPIYRSIAQELVRLPAAASSTDPLPEALADDARALAAARAARVPALDEATRTRVWLDTAQTWLGTLSEPQRRAVADGVWVLRKDVQPELLPAEGEPLMPPAWRREDFASLQRLQGAGPKGLDISTLWALPGVDPTDAVKGPRLAALAALLLAHPGLIGALDASLGHIPPDALASTGAAPSDAPGDAP